MRIEKAGVGPGLLVGILVRSTLSQCLSFAQIILPKFSQKMVMAEGVSFVYY